MTAALLAARGAADRFRLPSRPLVAAGIAVSLAASFLLLRGSLGEALARLTGARTLPLALAAGLLLVPLAASASAWRSALVASGAAVGTAEAMGCYGVGSLANTILPARLGEALRAGLFASRLPDGGRAQAVAGAWALVGAARAGVSAALLAAAAAAGLVPVWLAAIPALAALALAGMRAALGRARGVAAVGGWLCLSALSRLAALVLVLTSLGIHAPLGPAFVSLVALGIASSLPLAPGAAGMAGAAMALSIRHDGVDPGDAAAAAMAFHALETLASCAFGAAGLWVLRGSIRERGRGAVTWPATRRRPSSS
jgi:uncharacterized membrane protein YbhN (UPF0104 family)